MAKGLKVSNEVLVQAGLELMHKNGKALTRLPSKGRSMLYALPNGESVRLRTCNDHVLIALASSPDAGASLNIEGTDWLLFVVPKEERTPGEFVAYLLPTEEVVSEVRKSHQEWLDGNPNTKGSNTTWNLWFREGNPPKSSGYDRKWAGYRLPGTVSTTADEPASEPPAAEPTSISKHVEAARRAVAAAAGVPVASVKISIDFGSPA